jgi:hypothetical protein
VGFSLAQTPDQAVVVAESSGQWIDAPLVIPAVALSATAESSQVVSVSTFPASTSSILPHSDSRYFARSLPSGLDWATTVLNAKQRLRVESLPEPSLARAAVEQAGDDLVRFLSTARDERYANWLIFLRWNELQELLRGPEPEVDALIQLERNMRQNYFGLELPQFVRLRESLENYISSLRFGANKVASIEMIDKRLDQLSETLQKPADGSDLTRQREIGLIASILAQSKQTPELLQSVRGQFSRPNVRVLVSNDFVQRQFTRPVDQQAPVREVILGTQIFGTSYSYGSVVPQLLDNPNHAALRLILSAHMSSNNIGYNRGVKIYTRGNADINVTETIALTEQGLISQNDTSVYAPLHSTITGIDHKLRIVEKLASKRAAKQKPLADSIAQGRLNNRAGSQFHEQLQSQLSKTNEQFRDRAFPVLTRLGLSKPKRTSWSSGNFLSMLWKQQDADQLAAPSSCPLVVMNQGITVQVHQSAVINMIDPVIGGRTIHHNDLDDIVRQLGAEQSAELKEEVSGEAWSIDMAGFHPVEVELDNQLVKFRIRTTKLDRGDQALDQEASIDAAYKVQLQDGAIQLIRQGDVAIEFTGKAQRGLKAVTMRSFLKNKFDSVFKQELLKKPFRLADRLPAGAPNLNVVDVQVDDGWIQATLM